MLSVRAYQHRLSSIGSDYGGDSSSAATTSTYVRTLSLDGQGEQPLVKRFRSDYIPMDTNDDSNDSFMTTEIKRMSM